MEYRGESLNKHNRKIRKVQNKDKKGNPEDFDINKLRHRIQEKKVNFTILEY